MTYKDVIEFLKDDILEITGSLPDDYELHFADLEHIDEHTLDYNIKENTLTTSTALHGDLTIRVEDAKLAIALLGDCFFVDHSEPLIHPTAVVYPCVTLGKNVRIGPYAVIGAPGFGFVRKSDSDWIRFPQLGRVIIGDNVEIGAQTTIDRGALSDTIIGRDVKINESVHIAHNVQIGEHTVITANVNISGSSKIGANVWIAPGAILRDHSVVGDNSLVGMGSVVAKPIPANEIWCGNPAKKLRDK